MYKLIVNWLLGFVHNFRDRVQDKSLNLTTGAARFKLLLNSKLCKSAGLPVHLVSEFTHSFSFTPSSDLYEWTNEGNKERGVDFGYSLEEAAIAASSSCMTGVRVKVQYCHLEVNQVLALEYYMWCYHKSPVHFKYSSYRQYRYIVTH